MKDTIEDLVLAARRALAPKANGHPADASNDQYAEFHANGCEDPPPQPCTIRELVARHPNLRPPLVDGLLRQGETANVIGTPKFGKSWLTASLLLSVSTGTPWLGQFQVQRRDVLLLDNELHAETLAYRLPKVADAMGIAWEDYADRVRVEPLRGKGRDLYAVQRYLHGLRDAPGLIVCDSWYRFMPRGCDENDNGTATALYNLIDECADALGSSFVLIHHASKGMQADKSITDVGAGAGAQSRAADTHMILRPHEEKDCYVVDAAVRSFKPIEPFVIRFDWPVFRLATELDPAALRRPQKKAAAKAAKPEFTVETFVAAFISDHPKTEDAILVAADAQSLSDRKAKRLLKTAEEEGKVHRWSFGPKSKAKYASTPQPVTETMERTGR